MNRKGMKIQGFELSDNAAETVRRLRLRGESSEECVDRLLENLLSIALDKDNYAQHFGAQRRRVAESENAS